MRLVFGLAAVLAVGLASVSHADSPAPSTKYAIEEVMHSAQATLVKKATVKSSEFGTAIAPLLSSVGRFCKLKNILITGAPYARFFRYEPNGIIEFETGVPAITAQPLEDGIEVSALPAGRAILTLHKGPYEKIGPAYDALHAWIDANHAVTAGGPWEVYLNDPTSVPASELLTRIYYPIK